MGRDRRGHGQNRFGDVVRRGGGDRRQRPGGRSTCTNGGGFRTSGTLDLGLNAATSAPSTCPGRNSTLSTNTTRVAGDGRVNGSAGGQWFSNGLVTIGGTDLGIVSVAPRGRWAAGDITITPNNGVIFQTGGTIDVFGTFTKFGQYSFDDGQINVSGTFVNGPVPTGFGLNGGTATSLPTLTIMAGGTTSNITTAIIGEPAGRAGGERRVHGRRARHPRVPGRRRRHGHGRARAAASSTSPATTT